jgi:hypothetical protein
LDGGRILHRREQHHAPALLPVYPGSADLLPVANAIVSSPFQISAGATTSSGYLSAVRVYVDNVS